MTDEILGEAPFLYFHAYFSGNLALEVMMRRGCIELSQSHQTVLKECCKGTVSLFILPNRDNLTKTGLQYPLLPTEPTSKVPSSSSLLSPLTVPSCLWDTSVYFLDISYTLQIHSVHGWKVLEGTLSAAAKLCLVYFFMR